MIIKTKNFHPETDPRLRCSCGHADCDRRSVRQDVLNWVQRIRDDADRPLTITSGGRCPNHPDEQHRTKPADHQNGVAVDIGYKTIVQRNEIMVLAGRYGATAVAFGRNFVHVGWRDLLDNRLRTWEYKS